MKRGYASLPGPEGSWQIHYREHGSGPPCVMLHPSPMSSAMLVPTMHSVAPMARCIAWDTPGYGYSDPLPQGTDVEDLSPYVAALHAFVCALELDRPVIYGSATGAQIAIEYAKAHQDSCGGLLLENAALFSEDDIARLLDGYFPKVTPQDDGSHLLDIWNMARNSTRYFPWNDQSADADRRGQFPDATIIAGIVRDYILAGEDYARAYRVAFANERLDKIQAVEVPVRLVLWKDGLLGEYGQRLADATLPENISVVHAAGGMPERMRAVSQAAQELIELRNAAARTIP